MSRRDTVTESNQRWDGDRLGYFTSGSLPIWCYTLSLRQPEQLPGPSLLPDPTSSLHTCGHQAPCCPFTASPRWTPIAGTLGGVSPAHPDTPVLRSSPYLLSSKAASLQPGYVSPSAASLYGVTFHCNLPSSPGHPWASPSPCSVANESVPFRRDFGPLSALS